MVRLMAGARTDMATYVTGDIHASYDIHKLATAKWMRGRELTGTDRVLICGDFGLVWSDPPAKEDVYWLDWLESKPWGETLFVDGNHENHDLLDSMPVSTWHGGRVHRLPGHPSIIHLMRGETYQVDGDTWWCFGGALSNDKGDREEAVSWWSREAPSDEEMEHGLQSLAAIGFAPDYVFTHDCPTHVIGEIGSPKEILEFYCGRNPSGNFLTEYFEQVDKRLEGSRLKRWYFGHWHQDLALDERHVLLYQQVVELGGTPEQAGGEGS